MSDAQNFRFMIQVRPESERPRCRPPLRLTPLSQSRVRTRGPAHAARGLQGLPRPARPSLDCAGGHSTGLTWLSSVSQAPLLSPPSICPRGATLRGAELLRWRGLARGLPDAARRARRPKAGRAQPLAMGLGPTPQRRTRSGCRASSHAPAG